MDARRDTQRCQNHGHVRLLVPLLEFNLLPKLFGQLGPGEWVFADHFGQRGVRLHGFAKGVFGGGGFLRGRHRAIRTRRAWLPSEKSNHPRTSMGSSFQIAVLSHE
jgi:hypothetical protein